MEGSNHFKNETSLKLHHPVPSKIKPIHISFFNAHTPLRKSRPCPKTQSDTLQPNYPLWLVCAGWHVRWVCWETLESISVIYAFSKQHQLSSNKLNHYHLSYREGYSEHSWMNTNKAHARKHPLLWSNTFEGLLELGRGGAHKSSISSHTKCLLFLSTNQYVICDRAKSRPV